MQKSQQTLLASEGLESQAGDVLLLPIALLAFWTLAYDFVLVVRWPAETITWFFLVIAVPGILLLRRLWKQTNAIPGKYYRFHVSHVLLLVLGIAYASTALFVLRPNQDDVRHVKGRDRKSTRLNSSHLVISYAVFCLKKKKNMRYRVHDMSC